jgi:glycosyltransferase involved in cell wall biosynthesis
VRVLIDYRAALSERSGVGEYTHELTRALVSPERSGGEGGGPIDVSLFSSSWKDRVAPSAELGRARIIDRRVPVSVLNFAWHRLEWPPVETIAGAQFDVVHSLHPLLMPARRAAQVVTIHDLDFLSHPERTRAEIRRDYPGLAPSHARRADRVIVVSQFTAGEVVRRLGVAPERISVCSPGAPPWEPRTSEHAGERYILFFGTLEPRKNVGGLLDAYERLIARSCSAPPLVLAGKATETSGPWLDRIARAPLSGRVRHIGYVDPAGRRALYEGAAVLVQPSFEEGFGLPVLEAMSAGVPVVVSNRGALPEVAGRAGAIVEPDDPDAMADAMATLIDDRAAAAEAAARGLVEAARYTWDETARRTIVAYQHALLYRAQHRGAA